VTPYAASKVAAEYLGLQTFLGRGLEVIRVRPFNHVGPGQADSFVVSALARRVVEAERSGSGVVRVGNLTPARDFTDVRDVVRAYRLLAELGTAGDVYNVCSGEAVPIETVLDEIIALAAGSLVPVEDPALMRPVDLPVLVGDGGRLAVLTGWKPEIPLRQTLAEVLADWRQRP
jgi:GDP-4-dehydro-6-deoxy-D-mannose reductase